LERSQVFDISTKPKNITFDEKVLEYISGENYSHLDMLISQWREFAREWRQLDELSPVGVYKYWESKLQFGTSWPLKL